MDPVSSLQQKRIPEGRPGEERTAFLLVQDRHGGGLIGRRGTSINEMRETSRCKITLQDRKLKFLNRRPVRALKLRGTSDQITHAIRLVTMKIKNVQQDASCAHELTLLAPQGLVTNVMVLAMAKTHGLDINSTPVNKHFDLLDFSGDAEPISLACRTMLATIWFEHDGEVDEFQLNDYGTQGPGIPSLSLLHFAGPNMPRRQYADVNSLHATALTHPWKTAAASAGLPAAAAGLAPAAAAALSPGFFDSAAAAAALSPTSLTPGLSPIFPFATAAAAAAPPAPAQSFVNLMHSAQLFNQVPGWTQLAAAQNFGAGQRWAPY